MKPNNRLYEAFIAELPHDRTQEFHSPEELESALQAAGVNQPTRQISVGEFRAHLAVTETNGVTLISDRYSTAVAVNVETPKDAVGFLFPRTLHGAFTANGIDIGDEMLLAFPTKSEVDISGLGPMGSDCIAVNEDKFWSIANTVCPGLEQRSEAIFIPGDVNALHGLRSRLIELGATPNPGPADLDVFRLVTDLIFWIAFSHGAWPRDTAASAAGRIRLAKHAQDYIEAHYRDAVHIEDLCRATGVGARTLQRCFREYFHVTISQYLKITRLDSARRELAAADRESTSVTTVAMENGLSHLGRFSVDYRQHFGESPRETLATTGQQH